MWNHVPCSIKSLFHEHTLKYAEVVEDCAVTSDLQGKQNYTLEFKR